MISIVIPSYNHEAFIGEAIDSILKQSYQDFEIIIVDDGSTDNTKAVLARFERKERIKIFYQENHGAAHALNRGVAESSGEYLAILNSDDLYHPQRFAILVGIMDKHSPEEVVLYTNIAFIDQHAKPLGQSERSRFHHDWLAFYREHLPPNHFIHGNLLTTTSNLFLARKTFEKIGGFVDLRYCHDWEWILRSTKYAKTVFVDQALLCYRVHSKNTILEQDMLRHCLENAFAFSSLLNTPGSRVDEKALFTEMELLTKSKFFFPFMVTVVIHLRNSLGDERTLDLIKSRALSLRLEGLLEEFGSSKDAFYSLLHVKEVVDALHLEIDKGHQDIKRLGEFLNHEIEKGHQEIRRLFAENNTLSLEICRLTATQARHEEFIAYGENSSFYRARIISDRLRRWLTQMKRFPHFLSLRGSSAISSNLASGSRYLYQLDQPVFDSQRRCTLNSSGESTMQISGWLGDMLMSQKVDTVLIISNEIEYRAVTSQLRPDVAKAFNALDLAHSGFSAEIPTPGKDAPLSFRIGIVRNSKKLLSAEQFEITSAA